MRLGARKMSPTLRSSNRLAGTNKNSAGLNPGSFARATFGWFIGFLSVRRQGRLLLDRGMDFGDVASRKLNDNSVSLVGLIWTYEHGDAACLCLRERVRQIRYLISRHLPAVRIRKVTIGNQRGQL